MDVFIPTIILYGVFQALGSALRVLPAIVPSDTLQDRVKIRYETYLIPGETLIPGEETFHPGIGYASYLN